VSDEELTYRAALDELRVIHGRLREDEVDVDRLLDDVKRASDLLAFCRRRLTAVGERLEEVLEGFEEGQ
jgi:exodeoxyribonuclease VII small subunit